MSTAPTTTATAGNNRLPVLAAEINARHREAEQAAETAIGKAAECGRLLREAKAALGHGRWLPWVDENLPFGSRQAQKYMRLVDHLEALSNANSGSHLTINDAMGLLAAPVETVEAESIGGLAEFKKAAPWTEKHTAQTAVLRDNTAASVDVWRQIVEVDAS